MYVHPKLQRFLTQLDTLESNLRTRGINRMGRDVTDPHHAVKVQTAKEFIAREPQLEGQPATISFRHSGWANARNKVARALRSSEISDKTVGRFLNCGRRQWVVREKAGERRYRVMGNYCKSRWCVPCGRAKATVLQMALRNRLEATPTRFVTLTLRHDDKPLKVMLDKLYECFRKLQRTKLWTDCVTGGAAFLEIKRGKGSSQWHPHLHCIVKGGYLPQKKLSQVWRAITTDSHIVDVRLVRKPNEVCNYITKYVTKPLDRSVIDDEATLIEAINTLHGRRSMTTFGDWRSVPLKPTTQPCDYEPVAYLDTLLEHARNGTAWALGVYAELRRLPNSMKEHRDVDGFDYDP